MNTQRSDRKAITAGIILAGGQSRRMGRDKALLNIGGKTVIERVKAAVEPCVGQLCLASASDRGYEFLHLPMAPDEFPGHGPLSGLYAGMNAMDAEWYVLSACDLPFASTSLLEHLLDQAYDYDFQKGDIPLMQVVIPSYDDRMHPLYGVYHHSVRASLAEALQQRQFKVMDWVDQHNLMEVPLEGVLKRLPPQLQESNDLTEWCLYNMNDPEAYEQARHLHILNKPFDS
ncbi:molybdenum cofactor guanylyltransferase [Paenibacillus kandeliae]|uniref:molybdenum cofactor guanylyltransferase n=1 Tax=Paenibacillus kandeliae TaxID=3231269 RepID=UPI0034585316